MKKLATAIVLAAAALAAPANAVTILFGGANATPTSLSGSAGGIDYTLTAARFTVAPGALDHVSQIGSALRLRVTAPGVGVDGGGSAPQVDTNQANRREALVLKTSSRIAFSRIRLSYVDANDTFALFGVMANGDLAALPSTGTIRTGLGGTASVVNQNNLNQGTSTLTLADDWGWFDHYIFTTRVGGDVLFGGDFGQGYRLDSLSFNAVPEPATWTLLIAGFGFVGAAARRQRISVHSS
jgi:hypothetical protein